MLVSLRRPRAHFTHLTRNERELIRRMLVARHTQAEIARTLGKSCSTISRELRRNRSSVVGSIPYFETHAQAYANRRRLAAKAPARIIENDEILERYIVEMLSAGLSPEQIAGFMRRTNRFPRVSCKTMYSWVHRKWQSRKAYLRFRGRARVPYGERKRAWQPHKRHISERPKIVQRRERVGDWEADLVHGNMDDSRHCLLILNERRSGFGLIFKLSSLDSQYVAGMMHLALKPFPVSTITCDNGREFAYHRWLERKLRCKVYFTDVQSPQQRGSNENFNGLIRQYFPKGKSMVHVTQDDATRVAQLLNKRPRKRLDYECPRNVLAALTGRSPYAPTLKQEY